MNDRIAVRGDLADGAIAYEGAWLGGETFASFRSALANNLTEIGMPP